MMMMVMMMMMLIMVMVMVMIDGDGIGDKSDDDGESSYRSAYSEKISPCLLEDLMMMMMIAIVREVMMMVMVMTWCRGARHPPRCRPACLQTSHCLTHHLLSRLCAVPTTRYDDVMMLM